MILTGAPADAGVACRRFGLAVLVVVSAVAVLAAPTEAHQKLLVVPGLTEPWDEAEPPDEPEASADPDPDDSVNWDALAEPTVPAGSDPVDPDDPDDPPDPSAPGEPGEPGAALDLDTPGALPDELLPVTATLVPGTLGRRRTDGKAAIPSGAPARVRMLIRHINTIVGKRSKRGGGHARLDDKGYDGSGAVSYGLIKANLLKRPIVGHRFARWGEAGAGRWVTVYVGKRHVYMEIAGLRLDTSTVGDDPLRKGVQWRPVIGRRPGFKVRHPNGL